MTPEDLELEALSRVTPRGGIGTADTPEDAAKEAERVLGEYLFQKPLAQDRDFNYD